MADEMQLPVPPDECLDDAQDQEFWRRFEARVAEEQARGPASRARRATNALVFFGRKDAANAPTTARPFAQSSADPSD